MKPQIWMIKFILSICSSKVCLLNFRKYQIVPCQLKIISGHAHKHAKSFKVYIAMHKEQARFERSSLDRKTFLFMDQFYPNLVGLFLTRVPMFSPSYITIRAFFLRPEAGRNLTFLFMDRLLLNLMSAILTPFRMFSPSFIIILT